MNLALGFNPRIVGSPTMGFNPRVAAPPTFPVASATVEMHGFQNRGGFNPRLAVMPLFSQAHAGKMPALPGSSRGDG